MSDNNKELPVMLDGLGLWGSSFTMRQCTHCMSEDYNLPEELCYVFRADCGGDSISICKKHLKMVLDEMDKVSK